MTPEDVQRILSWPRETRSPQETERLTEYRAAVHREMWQLTDDAERFDRGLTPEERQQHQRLSDEFARLSSEVPSRR
jgi:hypothetical protein